jgi:plasmid stabilization system protein ParE
LRPRIVRFTETARRHVEHERTWWLENRDYLDLFAADLESAVRLLALLPSVGRPYTRAGMSGLRRLYLEKVTCHLYYTFDEDTVIVRALWGARRERGPVFD